ncbi:MAG TPA: HAD family hydrolase [Candidatus Acidoferrales bacterium]|nr:HAD family hydrolase [Candidatus Acidoferrales bacterium]
MWRETLLIDADDTLWENQVHFERVIDEFLGLLEHLGFSRPYVRRILNETERRNIRQFGFGVRSFHGALEETYLKLAGNIARRELVKQIGGLVAELAATPPTLLAGVADTLAYLAGRHRLILCTKGEPAEQAGKLEKSGVQVHFQAIEIVAEKDSRTFRALVKRHRIVKTHGWMVGNSPRSDINPALAVGLNAVFIPHARTWEFEHDALASGPGKLLVLQAFRALREYF